MLCCYGKHQERSQTVYCDPIGLLRVKFLNLFYILSHVFLSHHYIMDVHNFDLLPYSWHHPYDYYSWILFVFFVICLSPPYLHECVLSYSSPISHGGMHQLKLRRRKSDVPTCIDVQKNVSLIALLSTSFLFQFLSLSCVFNWFI